ncbi:MFS transporter [Leifsonia shinshuensis]|uniref:MFS transporter n=1 Tax=Leifsonia shinshuensis TaxID=150026 RepID=UPI002864BE35|nr:MFS transporter [Leifsonia shinshuensis]MDR6973115.1 MFS family permease [Leifsonia shinshuensis]
MTVDTGALAVPARRTAPLTLPARARFWTAAAVAGLALWTSAAPTTSYPLYASTWHLTSAVTTAIFAVYPIVLVVFLLIFGQVSDFIGRRNAMLIGVGALFVGVLLFAIAPSVGWVFAGRAFMGAGVALALAPATAAAVEFSPRGRESRASSTVTAATAAGLALATVVGGGLIQYAPLPLHLDYWVLLVAVTAVLGLVYFLPRNRARSSAGTWRPRPISIPRGIRLLYVAAASAVTGAYAFGSVFLALGADVAKDLIGSTNVLVTGSVLAIMSVMIGVSAVLGRRFAPGRLVIGGAGLTLVDLVLLVLSAQFHSLPLFMITTVFSGAGYGLLFSGGLGLIATHAPQRHRGGTISAVYLVAYVFQGVIAFSLGGIATAVSLGAALFVGAIVIGVLATGALVLAGTVGRATRRES